MLGIPLTIYPNATIFLFDMMVFNAMFYMIANIIASFLNNGKGGKEGAVQKCGTCKGRGMVVKMTQLGPGMSVQSQEACNDCHE